MALRGDQVVSSFKARQADSNCWGFFFTLFNVVLFIRFLSQYFLRSPLHFPLCSDHVSVSLVLKSLAIAYKSLKVIILAITNIQPILFVVICNLIDLPKTKMPSLNVLFFVILF